MSRLSGDDHYHPSSDDGALTSSIPPQCDESGGNGIYVSPGDGASYPPPPPSRELLPVLIIPGFMSSGLEVKKSILGKKWVSKRVWLNLSSLGFSSLYGGGSALRVTDKIKNDEKTIQEEFKRQVECKSKWLQHMSLSEDMINERDGMEVRAIPGLAGVDYLSPGTLTSLLSYVFGPVIKALKKAGYTDDNLDAAPYDWRVTPSVLESRDGYFTNVMRKVEDMYRKNDGRPVVLLCHSMGCKAGHYFLNFAKSHPQGGHTWLEKYVHTYMPVGAPHLGAPKSLRATVNGDKMGLDTFLSDEEGLVMGRSLGSGQWLMPRELPLRNAPFNVFLRREGAVHVTVSPVECQSLFRQGRARNPPKKLRLVVKFNDDTLTTEYKKPSGSQALVEFPETFTFAASPEVKQKASDTFEIALQEPGIASAKKTTKEKTVYRSCICCPIRFVIWVALCPIRYILCFPCCCARATARAALLSANATAAAAGTGTRFASTETHSLSGPFGRRNDLEFYLPLVPVKEDPNGSNLFSWFRKPNVTKVRVRIRWEPSTTDVKHAETCSPIAAPCAAESSCRQKPPLLEVQHNKKKDVVYKPLRGDQLLQGEGLIRTMELMRDWYDTDPVGPRTHSAESAPPVRRVVAIYGVNLPTEVGAVYRRAPSMIRKDHKVQRVHVVDKKCQLKKSMTDKYQIQNGIVLETKKTSQVILGPAFRRGGGDWSMMGSPRNAEVVNRSGDGTVPYWSLQHCRTWRGQCDVTVHELEGAEHRMILANGEFHRILVDYLSQNSR